MTKEPTTSPGLRLTLALLMMDACTGKICSLQRVGSFSGHTKLCESGFTNLLSFPGNYAHGKHELKHRYTSVILMERSGQIVDAKRHLALPCPTWVATGACPFGRRCGSSEW